MSYSTPPLRFRIHIALGLVACGIVFVGCRKETAVKHDKAVQQNSEKLSLDSPRSTLARLSESLASNNEGLFLSCFTDPKEADECLRQVFRKSESVIQLRFAVVKSYGDAAWNSFQEQGRTPSSQPKLVPTAVPTEDVWWRNLETQTFGERAFFYNPITEQTNAMVQNNHEWKIETSSVFGPDVDYVKLADYLNRTTKAVRLVTTEVERRSISVDRLGFELYRYVFKPEA